MRAKLVHFQKILESLALEDFEQMAKHSQDRKLLNQESTWNVLGAATTMSIAAMIASVDRELA